MVAKNSKRSAEASKKTKNNDEIKKASATDVRKLIIQISDNNRICDNSFIPKDQTGFFKEHLIDRLI